MHQLLHRVVIRLAVLLGRPHKRPVGRAVDRGFVKREELFRDCRRRLVQTRENPLVIERAVELGHADQVLGEVPVEGRVLGQGGVLDLCRVAYRVSGEFRACGECAPLLPRECRVPAAVRVGELVVVAMVAVQVTMGSTVFVGGHGNDDRCGCESEDGDVGKAEHCMEITMGRNGNEWKMEGKGV